MDRILFVNSPPPAPHELVGNKMKTTEASLQLSWWVVKPSGPQELPGPVTAGLRSAPSPGACTFLITYGGEGRRTDVALSILTHPDGAWIVLPQKLDPTTALEIRKWIPPERYLTGSCLVCRRHGLTWDIL